MNDVMTRLLTYRVLFISCLFGAFGKALSSLLKIEDMKYYYPALAILMALAVSLLISFLIKAKWSAKLQLRLKIFAVTLFFLFITVAIIHTYYIINHTFEYTEFDETNRYVNGDYSAVAMDYKKKYPHLTDEELLNQKFGGPDGITVFWTPASVNNNIFILIITYCCVVIFLVGTISLTVEILAFRYPKSSLKTTA